MPSWSETGTQIVREWTFVPYTDEELHKMYQQTVVKYIREKYTVNDENEILREYLAYGESKKADFDEYNVSYVNGGAYVRKNQRRRTTF